MRDYAAEVRDFRFKMLEPLTRIEPVTSSLPKKCSTSELQGQLSWWGV
jgi:hypothetical protein